MCVFFKGALEHNVNSALSKYVLLLFGSGRGRRCWGWVGDRIGFGLYQFWRNMGKVEYVSVFWLPWCGWCWGGAVWAVWARVLEDVVVLCLCVLWVWILCVDGRSRYLYIVLGGLLRILGAPSVQSCCTLTISASKLLSVGGSHRKSRLVCVW